MAASGTRDRIVEAADHLFYEQGFEHTSFADVAKVVGISRGNFYYHFETKDQILDAVIKKRLQEKQVMLETWAEEGETPDQRIAGYIRLLLMNREQICSNGCPLGSLFTELCKMNHPGEGGARGLFDVFRVWLKRQFEEMGRAADADDLALHLLAWSQGVATLANAYPDEAFLEKEVARMLAWLDDVKPSAEG